MMTEILFILGFAVLFIIMSFGYVSYVLNRLKKEDGSSKDKDCEG